MIKTEFIKKPHRSVLSTVLWIVLGSSIVICGIALTYAIQKYRIFSISKAIHHGREEIVSLKSKEQVVLELLPQIEQINMNRTHIDSLRSYAIPAYSIVREIELAKPRAAELQFMNVNPDSIELVGVVPLNRIAVDFVRQLKSSSLFSAVELVELKAVDGLYGLEYKIVVRLTRQS